MDFVYLCREGENEELRYSIRSVYHFYPEANVWVVGGKPDWYIGNHIPVQQIGPTKFDIVLLNIAAIADSKDIGDNPIIMNDDFFFAKRVDEFKPWAYGTIKNRILEYRKNMIASSYVGHLANLLASLKHLSKNPIDFELHVPMQVNKNKLKEMLRAGITTMWRSNYGNRFFSADDVEYIRDVKFYNKPRMHFKEYDPRIGNQPFFSTEDSSFDVIKKDLLSKMFPIPTKDEKLPVKDSNSD